MDAGAGGAFPFLDVESSRTPTGPGRGHLPLAHETSDESGTTWARRRPPSDLDLPHRVGADQPEMGKRQGDRKSSGRAAVGVGGPGRSSRPQSRNCPPARAGRWGAVGHTYGVAEPNSNTQAFVKASA